MTDNPDAPGGTIVTDGTRIDRASQKILTRLNESKWTYATKLREAAELSQNRQVFYRMEEHLIPAGFVEEAEREESETGYQDRRKFRLTTAGSMWLDGHVEDVAVPKSRSETQEMAYEAQEAAESAKSSVQSYRKKLHRLKESTKEALETVSDEVDTHDSRLMDVERRSRSTKREAEQLSDGLAELESDHDELAELSKDRFENQESEIVGLREENAELREELEELQSEVVEMHEEMNRGWVERIRRKLS